MAAFDSDAFDTDAFDVDAFDFDAGAGTVAATDMVDPSRQMGRLQAMIRGALFLLLIFGAG